MKAFSNMLNSEQEDEECDATQSQSGFRSWAQHQKNLKL